MREIVTMTELSKNTPYKYRWLKAASDRKHDPLPTIQRAKQREVIVADFVEWLRRNYGNDGALRGTECLDIKI